MNPDPDSDPDPEHRFSSLLFSPGIIFPSRYQFFTFYGFFFSSNFVSLLFRHGNSLLLWQSPAPSRYQFLLFTSSFSALSFVSLLFRHGTSLSLWQSLVPCFLSVYYLWITITKIYFVSYTCYLFSPHNCVMGNHIGSLIRWTEYYPLLFEYTIQFFSYPIHA